MVKLKQNAVSQSLRQAWENWSLGSKGPDELLRAADEIDRLCAVLDEIATMKPTELAPTTFPGLVHGPALMFDNCQRFAREALRGPKKAKRPAEIA